MFSGGSNGNIEKKMVKIPSNASPTNNVKELLLLPMQSKINMQFAQAWQEY